VVELGNTLVTVADSPPRPVEQEQIVAANRAGALAARS
jgi:hypothetical protein